MPLKHVHLSVWVHTPQYSNFGHRIVFLVATYVSEKNSTSIF
jgi:hypothetical protein